MADEQQARPADLVKDLYGEAESRTARAFEQVVSRASFGELLARVTENVVALAKIQTDVFDLVLRNMRLAGRQDVTRLARQLARTEDKLELLLQEVEQLGERLDSQEGAAPSSSRRSSANGRDRSDSARGSSPAPTQGGDSS